MGGGISGWRISDKGGERGLRKFACGVLSANRMARQIVGPLGKCINHHQKAVMGALIGAQSHHKAVSHRIGTAESIRKAAVQQHLPFTDIALELAGLSLADSGLHRPHSADESISETLECLEFLAVHRITADSLDSGKRFLKHSQRMRRDGGILELVTYVVRKSGLAFVRAACELIHQRPGTEILMVVFKNGMQMGFSRTHYRSCLGTQRENYVEKKAQ